MVWSGEAASLIARTLIGEIGILPRHEPVLALLDDGEVKITLTDESVLRVAVHRGFLTVDSDSVTILADSAELADDIDVARAEAALARAQADAERRRAAAAAASGRGAARGRGRAADRAPAVSPGAARAARARRRLRRPRACSRPAPG